MRLQDRLKTVKEFSDRKQLHCDQQLHALKRRLEAAYVKERHLRQERLRVERELGSTRKSVTKHHSRTKVLDKTRKLGYLEDKSPQIYGKIDQADEESRAVIHRLSQSLDVSDADRMEFIRSRNRRKMSLSLSLSHN